MRTHGRTTKERRRRLRPRSDIHSQSEYHSVMVAQLSRKRRLSHAAVAATPPGPGVYVLYGAEGAPAFVGAVASLRTRLASELATGRIPAVSFRFKRTATLAQAHKLERKLLIDLQPRFNVNVHSTAV